jgi:hypothetical protein
MKNNLENSIKESVKVYELPYDPSAWEAMSKKLDQVMPVSPKSNLKWYLGGAATVAVIVTTIALWPADQSTSNDTVKTAQNELNTANRDVNSDNTSLNATNNKSDKTNTVSQDATLNKIEVANDVNPVKQILNEVNIITPVDVNPLNQNTNNNGTPKGNIGIPTNGQNSSGITSDKIEFIATTICLGQNIEFTNKNETLILVQDPSGNKSNVKSSFKPKTEGQYSLGYTENGKFHAQSITVLQLPIVDFVIDDQNSYENGIPSVNVSATTTGYSYTWDLEDQKGSVFGKDISVHYFNKGSYKLSLTIQGSHGCQATETKTIQIADDYNLLAVNAFDPNANDMRLNSFMPFALTQRNVDFNMIIIDPKDGAVIFETNDATNHWTGIDKRNGQMVEANKAYIWKVVIQNPVKGEKSEYKSTIIRL